MKEDVGSSVRAPRNITGRSRSPRTVLSGLWGIITRRTEIHHGLRECGGTGRLGLPSATLIRGGQELRPFLKDREEGVGPLGTNPRTVGHQSNGWAPTPNRLPQTVCSTVCSTVCPQNVKQQSPTLQQTRHFIHPQDRMLPSNITQGRRSYTSKQARSRFHPRLISKRAQFRLKRKPTQL